MGRVMNYYVDGHTAKGFWSFMDSNLQDMQRVVLLMGESARLKSKIIWNIGSDWSSKGFDIEWFHSPMHPNCFNGVVLPDKKWAIVDGSPPHQILPRTFGVIEEYVSMSDCFSRRTLQKNQNEISQHTQDIRHFQNQAYACFAKALPIHDAWEKIYIEHIDFSIVNQMAESLIKRILPETVIQKTGMIKERFFGAATPQGHQDFIESLTKDLKKRIFIKGRPGTGKSTFLKKIMQAAFQKGFSLEVYHCGFDPNSLDMLIVRELGLAIFDATAPHAYFPQRDGDEILDIYEEAVQKGTDENHQTQLREIILRYDEALKEGISFLHRAHTLYDSLEAIYDIALLDAEYRNLKSRVLKHLHT
jgi:hypothetical protein